MPANRNPFQQGYDSEQRARRRSQVATGLSAGPDTGKQATGALAGGLAGSTQGAKLGTALGGPGVGTAIGAIGGGLAGAAAGYMGADSKDVAGTGKALKGAADLLGKEKEKQLVLPGAKKLGLSKVSDLEMPFLKYTGER